MEFPKGNGSSEKKSVVVARLFKFDTSTFSGKCPFRFT